MKKSLMLGFVVILALVLLISGFLNAFIFNRELLEETEREMLAFSGILEDGYDPSADADEQAARFAREIGDVRISIIAADGTVLGDSEVNYRTMDNHADRPELIEASAAGRGTSIRNSETLGRKLVYSAVKTADGHFIRATREVSGVWGNMRSIIPAMLLTLIGALTLASALTSRFSSRFLNPILEMNESLIGVKDGGTKLDPKAYRYWELEEMAVKINALSAHLSEYIASIQQEKDKLRFMLDNVNEGFLLLDEKQTVLLINDAACSYLGCTKSVIGERLPYAAREPALLRAAERALANGEREELDLKRGGRVFEILCSYVGKIGGMGAALIITLSDVTESRSAVRVRREFFSNASHELKTPITAIKGSAELLCSGLPLSETQKAELLSRIGLEAERMNLLISDILMISRMESGELSGEREDVELSALIAECIGELRPLAEREGLLFNTEISPLVLHADKKDLRALVSNLLVNAVKYNHEGGAVDVSLREEDGYARLRVHNDGESIPPEHQSRVFERFYRVDSGRSKAVGGTGLGLAIVKHAVDTLGGTVSLDSRPDTGTAFTVRLPLGDK